MTKIKIGLAGAGRAGWGMHCQELEDWQDEFEIVAACDILESRRERMRQKYNCRVYDKFEDMLTDPEVELVDIATRSSDHFRHAMMAMKAGKNVFLEKPITMNLEEALKLKQEAEEMEHGRLFIRHNRRFDPDFIHVREIISSGILGDVYFVKLRRHSYSRRDDWQTIKEFGGGQLLNWGPHIIDHSLRYLESAVTKLFCDLKHICAAGDCEDHLKIIMTGTNGRMVDMEISGGSVIDSPLYQVYGTRGALRLKDNVIYIKYLEPGQKLKPRIADPGTPGDVIGGSPDQLKWIEENITVTKGNNNIIWGKLYNSIRHGEEFPIHIDEAIEVMRIITEAKKGSDSNSNASSQSLSSPLLK